MSAAGGVRIDYRFWQESVKACLGHFGSFKVPEREKQEVLAVIASNHRDVVGLLR